MDFQLSPAHQEIQKICRGLAADFATRAAEHDREASLPCENDEVLKLVGLYSLSVPEELGGWGTGFLGWVLAAEELNQTTRDWYSSVVTLRLLLYHAAWFIDTQGVTPESSAALLRAKYFVGEAAKRIARSALTSCGTHALFKSSRLEQLFRDGASAPIQPPSSDACLTGIGMLELELEPTKMLPPLRVK